MNLLACATHSDHQLVVSAKGGWGPHERDGKWFIWCECARCKQEFEWETNPESWRVQEATTIGYMPPPVRHDWQTPDCVLERVRRIAPITLDPCTVYENPTGAQIRIYPPYDGLALDWVTACKLFGDLIYVNPPYGRHLEAWSKKIVESVSSDLHMFALVPSRTDTRWFHRMVSAATFVLFWKGRLTFRGATAPAPFPSALFYFGDASGCEIDDAFGDVTWRA